MKLIALLAIFALLAGCSGDYKTVKTPSGSTIQYQIIVIEGREYIATESYGNFWSLCPKQPQVAEKP